jgi:hypothetical protein
MLRRHWYSKDSKCSVRSRESTSGKKSWSTIPCAVESRGQKEGESAGSFLSLIFFLGGGVESGGLT